MVLRFLDGDTQIVLVLNQAGHAHPNLPEEVAAELTRRQLAHDEPLWFPEHWVRVEPHLEDLGIRFE